MTHRNENDLSKWRNMPCLWIRRLDIKISILSKLIYGFNAIPIKILADCLVEIKRLILKVMWKWKRSTIDKTRKIRQF